jgi:Flp pilus assembly protein TadG
MATTLEPAPLRRRRSCRAVVRGERGSATLELAIAFPVFLLLLISAVQGGLYFYARAIALSAAQEGVQAARLQSHTLDDGVTAARGYAVRAGGGSLRDVAVDTVGSTPTTVRITVSGTAPTLLPGWREGISQQAAGPRERYTSPGAP